MPPRRKSFGGFARSVRLEAGCGLRQAARKMGVSAAYLSRVENDVDPPSAGLTLKMSSLYRRPVEEFTAIARSAAVKATVRGQQIQASEDLRALYRMAESLTPGELDDAIRFVLRKRGSSEEEIERELLRLRAELPRLRQGRRDGLLAAEIKRRILSKREISATADEVLEGAGLGRGVYKPPTPVEQLVESQPGIAYRIEELPWKDVLGFTKRRLNDREIVINARLADKLDITSQHRFNFTLAHELFHAIEHLRPEVSLLPGVMRRQVVALIESTVESPTRRSAAQRAVDHWARSEKRQGLKTDEDWREWQANVFASSLLMPAWSVRREFELRVGIPFRAVEHTSEIRAMALQVAGEVFLGGSFHGSSLADLFDVSRQAMAIRLLELRLIREVQD